MWSVIKYRLRGHFVTWMIISSLLDKCFNNNQHDLTSNKSNICFFYTCILIFHTMGYQVYRLPVLKYRSINEVLIFKEKTRIVHVINCEHVNVDLVGWEDSNHCQLQRGNTRI